MQSAFFFTWTNTLTCQIKLCKHLKTSLRFVSTHLTRYPFRMCVRNELYMYLLGLIYTFIFNTTYMTVCIWCLQYIVNQLTLVKTFFDVWWIFFFWGGVSKFMYLIYCFRTVSMGNIRDYDDLSNIAKFSPAEINVYRICNYLHTYLMIYMYLLVSFLNSQSS